jgi:predicted transcriptional regulator
MEPKKPMLWTRVDAETAAEVQKLADEHYDGNLSMFVRQAIKRFAKWLSLHEDDGSPESEAAA